MMGSGVRIPLAAPPVSVVQLEDMGSGTYLRRGDGDSQLSRLRRPVSSRRSQQLVTEAGAVLVVGLQNVFGHR